MKTILIFEPQSGGHRANFIRWIKEASSSYPASRFVFFTAGDIGDTNLDHLGWWEKQKRLYRLFRQACQQHEPDHVLILELTHLELPLLLFGSPVPLSAILFVQYPELSGGWKKVSKHWKTRLLLWRAPIKNLFLLNGEKSCEFLRRHFSARFVPIADPAPDIAAETGFSLREHFGIDADKRVFLFFGAISKRKGADKLLDVLQDLSSDDSAFVFCGVPEADYEEEFSCSVAEVRDLGQTEIHFENQFVSDERMMAMFEQSDVVLMPYTRPEYSSGILSIAARAGTPVLGPVGGLLGRLIRENGLGATTAVAPVALAEALAQPISADPAAQRAFAEKASPVVFAKIILNSICNES